MAPLHVRLGHDDDALPGDIVLLEKLAEDPLRVALAVRVGRVERLHPMDQLPMESDSRNPGPLTLMPAS